MPHKSLFDTRAHTHRHGQKGVLVLFTLISCGSFEINNNVSAIGTLTHTHNMADSKRFANPINTVANDQNDFSVDKMPLANGHTPT